MDCYFVRDRDPQGGYFAIYHGIPIMSEQRRTIVEVRKGTFPDETSEAIDRGGEIMPHPETHFDELIIPHWDAATVWWTREGGYVNATE